MLAHAVLLSGLQHCKSVVSAEQDRRFRVWYFMKDVRHEAHQSWSRFCSRSSLFSIMTMIESNSMLWLQLEGMLNINVVERVLRSHFFDVTGHWKRSARSGPCLYTGSVSCLETQRFRHRRRFSSRKSRYGDQIKDQNRSTMKKRCRTLGAKTTDKSGTIQKKWRPPQSSEAQSQIPTTRS